jgi:hypothetical protein
VQARFEGGDVGKGPVMAPRWRPTLPLGPALCPPNWRSGAGRMDVSELRLQELYKVCWALLARHPSVLGHLHHGLQSVQPLTEHLALLHQGSLLLHGGTDTKELTHFIEGATEA